MNKYIFAIAFFLGATGIVWVGASFITTSILALIVTMLIGIVFTAGTHELQTFRRATSSLERALAAIPDQLPELGDWLASVPATLQTSVRLRIEGERIGMPGPGLTPYLVGLLVMLGMLGTFLGMVVTLNGAVFALQTTTDLEAIRSALSVPVKGLGLAFGTSVAGVGASAMLGLMSALSRRERALAVHQLDIRIATVLRRFSLTFQRQETLKALQMQSQILPAVVDQLQAMMLRMEQMSQQQSQQVSAHLLHNQENFHSAIRLVYTDLALSVDASLRESLAQGAKAAGETLQPLIAAAMHGIATDARVTHALMAGTVQSQLDALIARFAATTTTVADTWATALTHHQTASDGLASRVGRALVTLNASFDKRASALVASLSDTYTHLHTAQSASDVERQQLWTHALETTAATLLQQWQQTGMQTLEQQHRICATLTETAQTITEHAQSSASTALEETRRLITTGEELMRARLVSEALWSDQYRERMDQLASLMHAELGALTQAETARGTAAIDRLDQLQAVLTGHMVTLGTTLEEPLLRLIETASEAPRAAADVIGQFRMQMAGTVTRENDLLDERSRIMATLDTLLTAINHACLEQRTVIDSLVTSSAQVLNNVGEAFSDNVSTETARLADLTAHVTSSAVEVASLSESFGFAVGAFNDGNEKLIVHLQRIEGAMDKSMRRSDDQLAYYVAQARDIIDLSMAAQKQMVDELRQLPAKHSLQHEKVQ